MIIKQILTGSIKYSEFINRFRYGAFLTQSELNVSGV